MYPIYPSKPTIFKKLLQWIIPVHHMTIRSRSSSLIQIYIHFEVTSYDILSNVYFNCTFGVNSKYIPYMYTPNCTTSTTGCPQKSSRVSHFMTTHQLHDLGHNCRTLHPFTYKTCTREQWYPMPWYPLKNIFITKLAQTHCEHGMPKQ